MTPEQVTLEIANARSSKRPLPFMAGDVVRLKSGGPLMTVVWAGALEPELQAVWHNVNRDLQFARLAIEAFILVEEPK